MTDTREKVLAVGEDLVRCIRAKIAISTECSYLYNCGNLIEGDDFLSSCSCLVAAFDVISTVRNDVLEEAAKVADAIKAAHEKIYKSLPPAHERILIEAGALRFADEFAAALRALKE